MALDFLNNPSSALPGPKPARYYTDGDFDLFRQALLLLHGLFQRVAQIEGELGVNQAFRESVRETLSLIESRVDRLSAAEPHAEPVGATETAQDASHSATGVAEGLAEVISFSEAQANRLAAKEARSETAATTETGTARVGLKESATEAVAVTEAGSDSASTLDPFALFAASLPRPLQAGKYPVANASGGYDYRSANDVLVSLLAASAPAADVFWIDTSGVA